MERSNNDRVSDFPAWDPPTEPWHAARVFAGRERGWAEPSTGAASAGARSDGSADPKTPAEAREQTDQQASDLREQSIAVLAHDLRVPLATIAASAAALARRPLDSSERRAVERIERSARRMARLVEDMLDFARARLAGGIALSRSRVPHIEDCLRDVVDEVLTTHPDAEIRFEHDAPGVVTCDPRRIQQMFANLLVNAVEHGERGAAVKAAARVAGRELVIEVNNRGAPLASDELPRLFKPYERRTGDGEAPAGLGLGLYIVSQIAGAHGGRVEAVSSEEEGTTFRAWLPVR